MSLLGILLLIIGSWLLIYIKITNLITINYRKKTNHATHFAVIIKYQDNLTLLNKLLRSINIQTLKLDIDIYLFCNTLINIKDYSFKIIKIKDNFFNEIRNLSKIYDGYFILNSNSIINKNYFKDLKKDIVNNYDIIYLNNSYYLNKNILFNNLLPRLEREEELKYYEVYYNLKTITNKTLVYSYHKLNLTEKLTYLKNIFYTRKKYLPLIRKSLKYKLPNHYVRFKLCYSKYAYLLIIIGLFLIFLSLF